MMALMKVNPAYAKNVLLYIKTSDGVVKNSFAMASDYGEMGIIDFMYAP